MGPIMIPVCDVKVRHAGMVPVCNYKMQIQYGSCVLSQSVLSVVLWVKRGSSMVPVS